MAGELVRNMKFMRFGALRDCSITGGSRDGEPGVYLLLRYTVDPGRQEPEPLGMFLDRQEAALLKQALEEADLPWVPDVRDPGDDGELAS